MISFGYIYRTFVDVFYSLYTSLDRAAFGNNYNNLTDSSWIETFGDAFNIVGNTFYLIVSVLYILIYFQNLGRGVEMLVLRFGLPFACIGLLNADGGAFKGYIQKMIKVAFTVIVQLMLLKFSLILLESRHLILALATGLMAYRTPRNAFRIYGNSRWRILWWTKYVKGITKRYRTSKCNVKRRKIRNV